MFRGAIFIFIVLSCSTVIKGNPVIIESFEDSWDYRLKPQEEPLVKSNENHQISPLIKIREIVRKQIHENYTAPTGGEKGNPIRTPISCAICKFGVYLLQTEVKSGATRDIIRSKFVAICVQFEIQNEIVCGGIFDVFGAEVLPLLNVTKMNTLEICSLILGEVCGDVNIPEHQWEIQLPDIPKPPQKTDLDYSDSDVPALKVLHLSDTHFDPNYKEGSPAVCEEPLCCHSYSTPPENGSIFPAGKWGSYGKCDMPGILIEHMLKHIAEEHKDIDYIIWTGDLPPHDIWNQTRQSNLYVLKEAVKQMEKAFPNVPIFPCVGNHESVPAGSFAPPWITDDDHSISWLYDDLSQHWRTWLPASVNNTIFHGAFYSVLLRPGFRLISLNMNYCISVNWWLFVNSTDPAKQLQWLIHELQEAENKGEKVHIIGHVPPGDTDCFKVWSENYYKIINRYESTVVAQFYGHTHNDEFEVFYDSETYKRPIGIAYITPSITTFESGNPGYRVYYVDGDHDKTTREVLEHETWVTNLEEANKENSQPEWYKLYTAREAYSLSTLRPEEWSNLIDRMASDNNLFNLFYKHYYKDDPTRPPCEDNQCKLQLLCDLRSAKSQFRAQLCDDLAKIFTK